MVRKTQLLKLSHPELIDRVLGLEGDIAKLREQMVTDPLTGLKTRAYLKARLNELGRLAHRTEASPVAVLFVDVDNFKSVNDTRGYDTGDNVLRLVARVLQGHVRSCDVVARWGGDEFVIAMPGALPETARQVARRLTEAVCELSFDDGCQRPGFSQFRVAVSIGIAIATTRDPHESVIKAADGAMYAAKKQGRGQFFTGYISLPRL